MKNLHKKNLIQTIRFSENWSPLNGNLRKVTKSYIKYEYFTSKDVQFRVKYANRTRKV